MKALITSLLALLCLGTSAQTYVDKTDPFTAEKVHTAIVTFGRSPAPVGMFLVFGEVKGKKYVEFVWNDKAARFGTFTSVDPEKLSILIKMDNDTIFKFKPVPDVPLLTNSGNAATKYLASPIADDQLWLLSTNLIAVFRIGVNGDDGMDLDASYLFTGINKKQVQKAAAFMLGMKVFQPDPIDH